MNYLLDTHVLLWSVAASHELSANVKQVLENPHHSIFVSSISFWEISLKYSIGKLPLQGFTPDDFPRFVSEMGFKAMPLSPADSSTFHKFDLTGHRDPFDRMLMWQAIRQEMILISKDRNINLYSGLGLQILW